MLKKVTLASVQFLPLLIMTWAAHCLIANNRGGEIPLTLQDIHPQCVLVQDLATATEYSAAHVISEEDQQQHPSEY